MMTAVMPNQMAAKTGAVVRNFFMAAEAKSGKGVGLAQRGESAVRISGANQRGETVTLLSFSSNWPLVNSLRAARGQLAAAMVDFSARGTSI